MALCLASAQCEALTRAVTDADCACDREKVRVVHTYLQEQFPQRAVREFHSHSTLVRNGVPAPCADHHVVSISDISDEPSYCALLTTEFLAQPLADLAERLCQWDLARALRAERIVIVRGSGVASF